MTKEEILAKSRQENKGSDLVDFEIQSKSRGIAGASALTLGALLNFIIGLMYGTEIPIFWVIFFGYSAVQGITTFVLKQKKDRKSAGWIWLIYGIFMGIMTVFAVIRFFRFYGQAA